LAEPLTRNIDIPPSRPIFTPFLVPDAAFLGGTTNLTPVVGRVYLAGLEVLARLRISALSSFFGAAYAGNLRLGVYKADVSGPPDGGAVIYDSGSFAGGGATVVIHQVIGEIILEAGRYYLAAEFDTATANVGNGVARCVILDSVGSSKYPSSYYDRGGGYGAFTTPCPATTSALGHVYMAAKVSQVFKG